MKRSVLDDQEYYASLKFVAARSRKEVQRRVVSSLPLTGPTCRLNQKALPAPDGSARPDDYLVAVHFRHHTAASDGGQQRHHTNHTDAQQRQFTPLTLLQCIVDVLQDFETVRWDYAKMGKRPETPMLGPLIGGTDNERRSRSNSSASSESTNADNFHAKELARGVARCKEELAEAADITTEDLAFMGMLASEDTEHLAKIHGFPSADGQSIGHTESGSGAPGIELPRPDTALLVRGQVSCMAASHQVSNLIQRQQQDRRMNLPTVLRVSVNDTAVDVLSRLVETEAASVLVLLEMHRALLDFDRRIRGAILARQGALKKLKKRADHSDRASISAESIGAMFAGVGKRAKPSLRSAEAAIIENALRGGAEDLETEDDDEMNSMSLSIGSGSSLGDAAGLGESIGSESDLNNSSSLNNSGGDPLDRQRRREYRRHSRDCKAHSKIRKAQRKKVVAHVQKMEEVAKVALKGATQELRERADSVSLEHGASPPSNLNSEPNMGGRVERTGSLSSLRRRSSSAVADRKSKIHEASQKEKKRLAEYNTLRRRRGELQVHVDFLDVVDELIDTLQLTYLDITASAIALRSGGGSSSILKANCPLLLVRFFELHLSSSDGSPNRCFPSLLPPVAPFYYPRYKLEELQSAMRAQDDDDQLPSGGTSPRSPIRAGAAPSTFVPPKHNITHAEAYCREFVVESLRESEMDERRVQHQREALARIGVTSAEHMVDAFTSRREQLLWDVRRHEEELDKQRRRLALRAQMGKISNVDAQFEISSITDEIDRMYKTIPSGLSDEELQLMYIAPASPFQQAAAARIRSTALATQLRSGGSGHDDVDGTKLIADDAGDTPFSRGLLIPQDIPADELAFASEEGGGSGDAACVAEAIKAYYLTPLHLRRLQVSTVSLYSPSEMLLSYAHQLKYDLQRAEEANANRQTRQRNAMLFGPHSASTAPRTGGGTNSPAPLVEDIKPRTNSYCYPMSLTVSLQDTLKKVLSETLIPELLLRLEGDLRHYCNSYRALEVVAESTTSHALPLSINSVSLAKKLEAMLQRQHMGSDVKSKSPAFGGKVGTGFDRGDGGTPSLANTYTALDLEGAMESVNSVSGRDRSKKERDAELVSKRREREVEIAAKRDAEEEAARQRAVQREAERQQAKRDAGNKRAALEARRMAAQAEGEEAARAAKERLSRPLVEAKRKFEERRGEELQAQREMASQPYPVLEVQHRVQGSPGKRRVARRTEATFSTNVSSAPSTSTRAREKLVAEVDEQEITDRRDDFNIPRNNLSKVLNSAALEAKFLGPLTTGGRSVDPLAVAEAKTRPSDDLVGIVSNIEEKMGHERVFADRTILRKRLEAEGRMADRFHDGVMQERESSKLQGRQAARRATKTLNSKREERRGILDLYAKEGIPTSSSTRESHSAPSPGRPQARMAVGWASQVISPEGQLARDQERLAHDTEVSYVGARLRGAPEPLKDAAVSAETVNAEMGVNAKRYATVTTSDALLDLALASLGFHDDELEMGELQRQIDLENNPHNPQRTPALSRTPHLAAEIQAHANLTKAHKHPSIVDVYASRYVDMPRNVPSSEGDEIQGPHQNSYATRQRMHRARMAEVTAPSFGDNPGKAATTTTHNVAPPEEANVYDRLSILKDVPEEARSAQPSSSSPQKASSLTDEMKLNIRTKPPAGRDPWPQTNATTTAKRIRERTQDAQRDVSRIEFLPETASVNQ